MDDKLNEELIVKKIMEILMSELQETKDPQQTINFLGDDEDFKKELAEKVKVVDGLDLRSSWDNAQLNDFNNKILVSTLCIDGLISIAQGKRNFVIQALLNGGEVYVLEEGIEYKKYSEPKMLIKVYDEYLSRLKKYGIKFVRKEEFLNMFSERERVDIDGIITESKLKALGLKNKRIVLSKNSKITPLAWDYIRQNNIEVHYERGL